MKPPPAPLPIDALLDDIRAHLAREGALVLAAPPGAGKTTRVPPALLDLLPDGQIIVLVPRRIAAQLSAARVAEERGFTLGAEVGVQMRFESLCAEDTRLRYVTEGVLLRRMLREPLLPDVRCVILDEFHERHLHADLLLALLLDLKLSGARPDLKLCVMSATLDGERVAALIPGSSCITSEGRAHRVEIEYLDEGLDQPLHRQVRSALHRVLPRTPGDVLVFLPGAAEIRRALSELEPLAAERGLLVLPLHGDLPLAEQRRAVAALPGRRKVILATNVAETSVTIAGVTCVIDSGLARIAGHSPWSGLPTLTVSRICRASAAQRAGRAGRTQDGLCVRLYSRHDHESRREFDPPEMRRLDLSEAVLTLKVLGRDVRRLPFLDPPEEGALLAAEELLGRLGAIDREGAVTELGRRMALLPLHPRQARLVVEGEARGAGDAACAAAALLGERDIRLSGRAGPSMERAPREGPSDIVHLVDLFRQAARLRFDEARLRGLGLDARAAQAAERARRQLRGLIASSAGSRRGGAIAEPEEVALGKAVLAGYPDRVARVRRKGAAERDVELVLCGGGMALIDREQLAMPEGADLVAVLDAEARQPGGAAAVARLLVAIEAEWLLDLPGDPVREARAVEWNEAARRVEVVERMCYGALTLDERRRPGDGSDEAQAEVLHQALGRAGLAVFAGGEEALERLRQRLLFLRRAMPDAGLPIIGDELIARTLRELCAGRASFRELSRVSIAEEVSRRAGLLEAGGHGRLAALAPEHVVLPSGRRARIEYEPERPPHIASRMQDFFGLAEGPRVAGGRVPLVLHLLAPSGREVQVTSDLAGFWERHYPALRRELSRRYPKHAWPEDPRRAAPPQRRR